MIQIFTTLNSHFVRPAGPNYINRCLRRAQILLEFSDFQRLKQLAEKLSLARLLKNQPKFIYKYLSPYTAISFSRKMRLAAMLNHYQFLVNKVERTFFTAVTYSPVIWQQQCGNDLFTITLSYPKRSGFEGELSLNFSLNSTVVQVISFAIVPGWLVGSSYEQALFICQVQGTRNALLQKYATKMQHDITPAVLLVHAAYGLANVLGINQLVGISTEEQLCHERITFDYTGFWQQFEGRRTAANLFLLPAPTLEKPIQQIKSNHRARTLRKRQLKQQVRIVVDQHFGEAFLKRPQQLTY